MFWKCSPSTLKRKPGVFNFLGRGVEPGYLRMFKTIYAKSPPDFVGMHRAATRMHCAATRLHCALMVPRSDGASLWGKQTKHEGKTFAFFSAIFEIQDVQDLWLGEWESFHCAWWQLEPWMNNIHGCEAWWDMNQAHSILRVALTSFHVFALEGFEHFENLNRTSLFTHLHLKSTRIWELE